MRALEGGEAVLEKVRRALGGLFHPNAATQPLRKRGNLQLLVEREGVKASGEENRTPLLKAARAGGWEGGS